MIAVTHLSLRFGLRTLFDEASFHIEPRDRIALVGSNGAGKTTLLKILAEELTPESGTIRKAKYVTVGFLPQEARAVTEHTLYAEVQSAFGSVLELEARLEEVQAQLQSAQDSEELAGLVEIYGELQHQLEASDAFRMRAMIEKVLSGLGFRASDLARSTREFSGGWQMRIHLAKLLVMQPSLLLLDEPTNHLDLDSLEWVEGYIRGYQGAVMLVSHDRRFLDNLTTKTFELSLGKFTQYAGNFTFYEAARAERQELLRNAFKNQAQQLKDTERFIDRFRYQATKARQVQSRIKRLDATLRIELEDEEDDIHFAFPKSPTSARVALTLKGVHKSYGPLELFRGVDFRIERGDRIAFVGVNGAGKSTFSRIVAGVEAFERGERKLPTHTVVGYYAQHQADELSPELNALETLHSVSSGANPRTLRTLLGCFLFKGDDVFKRVGVLSGGEKSRLALAKLLLVPSNLLVLDEPTNHLDMRSKAVLQKALRDYDGGCVIVSHDRDFLDPLITKVAEFKDGQITVHLGNVSDYQSLRSQERIVAEPKPVRTNAAALARKALAEEKRQVALAEKKRDRELAALEAVIAAKEEERRLLGQRLADPMLYQDALASKEVHTRYRKLEAELLLDYERWELMQIQSS